MLTLTLTGVFILGGCEKTDVNTSQVSDEQILSMTSMDEIAKISVIKDPQVIAELDWLLRTGKIMKDDYCRIHKEGIIFDEAGSYPGVGDLFYSRTHAQIGLNQERNDKQARHRRTTYMYSGSNVRVRVYTNVPTSWKTEIQNACSAWNALGYNIAFSPYSATNNTYVAGELNINYLPIASTVIAQTYPPTSSSTHGSLMQINQNIYGITNTAMRMNIAHELGHSIGLDHTDTISGSAVSSTILCSTSPDPSSIMRTSIALNQAWTGFTTCDKAVIDYYWWSLA